MKTGYTLELLQTQKLTLTPEMRQAITVLQMSALELRSFILSQAEENPLIDLVETGCEESLPEPSEDIDDELLSYLADSSDPGPDLSRNTEPRRDRPFELLASDKGASLRDHLMEQLGVLPLSAAEIKSGQTIIGSIDDNGYLRCTVDEISLLSGKPKATVRRMLEVVQSFDPAGVGAADLRECLALQARARGMSGIVLRLIDGHLDDLAAGRYKRIAKEEEVSLSRVLSARDAVLSLDPKPGSKFGPSAVMYVVPEITVQKVGDEIQVVFNDSAMPGVRWNSFYRNLAKMGEQDAKTYLAREIKRAQTLFRCIEQRKATILRVMNAIVARQTAFFDSGPGCLGPLTLKDISEDVGVHESTVSRAIANKYVDTPYGVFPCRSFFSPRVRAGEAGLSQDLVKTSIQEIVGSEDPRDPLGDQEICRELEKRGMRVARRTVSKYRSQLGIMQKSKRKGV